MSPPLHDPPYNESDTRAKLIDPAIHARGWSEDSICREETEYSVAQGIEDGYLATMDIIEGRVNLDNTGITLDQIMARRPTNALTGDLVTVAELQAQYEATSFEKRVMLPDRVLAMCRDLFEYLVATGTPEQKTVIFCASDAHADDHPR